MIYRKLTTGFSRGSLEPFALPAFGKYIAPPIVNPLTCSLTIHCAQTSLPACWETTAGIDGHHRLRHALETCPDSLDESALLDRISRGQQEAFWELWAIHQEAIFGTCLRRMGGTMLRQRMRAVVSCRGPLKPCRERLAECAMSGGGCPGWHKMYALMFYGPTSADSRDVALWGWMPCMMRNWHVHGMKTCVLTG